jgi:hypothetical protein
VRERDRILSSLESVYREAFERARDADDRKRMNRLDFDFQRDQLLLEAVLDVRDLLAGASDDEDEDRESLLEKAKALRDLTRLR